MCVLVGRDCLICFFELHGQLVYTYIGRVPSNIEYSKFLLVLVYWTDKLKTRNSLHTYAFPHLYRDWVCTLVIYKRIN